MLVVGCQRHVGSTHRFSEPIADRASRYYFISRAAGAIILIGRQRATARQGGTEDNHYFVDLVADAIVAAATRPRAPGRDVFDAAGLRGVSAAAAGGAVRGIAAALSPANPEGRAPRTRAPTSGTPPRSVASGGAPLRA